MVTNKAQNAVIIEVTITAGKISIGFSLPIFCLSTATVVGISCIEQVFKTTKVIILSVAVSLCKEDFCSFSIAFSPNGVAAFPSPKKFADIFIVIASVSSLDKFLKRSFVMGLKNRLKISVNPDDFATCIIPLQKHIIPSKEIDKSTADFEFSIKEFVNSSGLPVIIEQKTEIIIIKVKSHFTRKTPLLRHFMLENPRFMKKIKKK